jgi:hypothetical protein
MLISRARIHFLAIATVVVVGSCARPDAVTAPSGRAKGIAKSVLGPGFVDNGLCGATCVRFNNIGPFWSAIANPDSTAIPVSIADVQYAPAIGDSLALQVGGDSAVLAAIGSGELLDVSDTVASKFADVYSNGEFTAAEYALISSDLIALLARTW